MKLSFVFRVLCSTLLCLMGVLPYAASAGPNVTVTVKYEYYQGGPGHTRQPTRSGGGGFVVFATPYTTSVAPGSTVALLSFAPTATCGGQACKFVFVNGQGMTQFSPYQVFQVTANANAVVQVIYAPLGGGGPCSGVCPTGASIDAFDESTGALVNDTFVNVDPPTGTVGTQLTTTGNVNGYVSTSNTGSTINALPYITPSGTDFDRWVDVGATSITATGAQLTVAKGSDITALALYKNPAPGATPPPPSITASSCAAEVASIAQWYDDGERPGLTVAMKLKQEQYISTCYARGLISQSAYNIALHELTTPYPTVPTTPTPHF